ncbi:MAG TPA: metal-dependent transcriptional regulator [Flavitalea sp.]|nr:metal-dependent transcriptional regulator [Flavitalea sp.]HTF29495.1 metal-dependent transcriptional regulator [Flavitalea sp.]
MKYSSSKENYVKAIFHLQETHGLVTTNALANELQTRPASVTDMLKKLKNQKLLIYEKYKGFKLTAEGRKIALQIVRKHRLWEFFLVEKLKFGWDEVHEIAEELEHISSIALVDRLDEFLGFPKSDPHGDPIPDSQGRLVTRVQVDLIQLPVKKMARVSSIGDQTPEMLELLTHKQIGIGTKLEVQKKFLFDNSLELRLELTGKELKNSPAESGSGKTTKKQVNNKPIVTVSEHVAKNVFVTYEE